MDQDLLKEVLNDHSKIDQISLFELDQWIDLYPFAQSLHFLKAKKLQRDEKVIDLQPFHRLACYTTDHANLYDLMIEQDYDILPSDSRKQKLNEKLAELINDAKTSEKNQLINQETTIETAAETSDETTVEQNNAKSHEIEEELADSEEEIQIAELEQMEPNESEFGISPIENDELIPKERTDGDQSLLDVSPKKKKKKKAKTSKKDKKKEAKKNRKKKASTQKGRLTSSNETDNSRTTKIQSNSEQDQYDPFTEWLLSLKPTSTENTKHTSMAKEKNSKKKKDKKGKKSSKKKILKKLEKKLKKQKKKDKKDKKKSKKINKLQRKIDASLERRAEAVSPTLAAFMKKQGYYKESIKIYKQLKLIYPEKSSYFASEIKKLKKLC